LIRALPVWEYSGDVNPLDGPDVTNAYPIVAGMPEFLPTFPSASGDSIIII
jgi:hypothetical protein